MRNRSLFAVLTLALSASLLGCDDENEPQDEVVVRYDQSADFASYETFALSDRKDLPEDVEEELPEDVRANIALVNNAVRDELISLGLTEVEEGETPDLYGFSLTVTKDQAALTWECEEGYYWWGYWGYTWDPCAWVEVDYDEYVVGTVVIGLADTAEEEVVFGGLLQGIGSGSGEDVEERVEDGIHRIFDQYPLHQGDGD